MFVIISSLGYIFLLKALNSDLFKILISAILLTGIFLPARHILKTHPYEYIYFNELAGNVNTAYSKYETDYYYHSMAEASNWLKQYIKSEGLANNKKIRVGLNFQPDVYFPNNSDNIEALYLNYYTRGNYDWDYAIICVAYIHPYQLENNIWPPSNTIHSIKIYDKTICTVLSRNTKDDFIGNNLYNKGEYSSAIESLKLAIIKESNNESALINLSKAYLKIEDYDNARKTINKCLLICPNLEQAVHVLGLIYYTQQKYDKAIQVFTRNVNFNKQYYKSYEIMAYCFSGLNDTNKAILNLKKSLSINSHNPPAIKELVDMLNKTGRESEAINYLNIYKPEK